MFCQIMTVMEQQLNLKMEVIKGEGGRGNENLGGTEIEKRIPELPVFQLYLDHALSEREFQEEKNSWNKRKGKKENHFLRKK